MENIINADAPESMNKSIPESNREECVLITTENSTSATTATANTGQTAAQVKIEGGKCSGKFNI